jgi:serine/threonine-protein kinase HipA
MTLARRIGLEVARVEIQSIDGIRYLQIERFDRRLGKDSRIERIHQEDFCQALGVVPELKYEQEGGPNLKQCFDLLRDVCSTPGPDILRLFDAVVFNVLIGNCDAHAKNFTFLRDGGIVRLAPLYDLVASSAYPSLAREMAMKIGGERNLVSLSAKNWHRFFDQAGIGQASARQRMISLCSQVLDALEKLDREDSPGANIVVPLVRQACARLQTLR